MLKSIELVGFKSFAKKGTLSFESPITAIVGPNGSGKSNTAEAFRFVLGEQGGKSMRIKKSTDLIWGGSHSLPRGSRAGVRVVLDNSQHRLNVDFDEVIIERTVLRDSTNEYSINGTKVRLKDVQDLLAGANVGSSGHHIISQGQADRVLGASPKERKEMLEDALGLKAYQLKKVEALRKLEGTGSNLEKAQSRYRELLPRLSFLKRQVERVEQAQQLKVELRQQAHIYLAHEQSWVTTERQELEAVLPEPSREIARVEQRLREIRTAVSNSKTEDMHNNIYEQEVVARKKELITVRSALATLRTELGKVTGQLEMLHVVRQRAVALPSSIARSEVKSLLVLVVQSLESGDSARAQELAERFITQKLGAEQAPNKKEDESLAQERSQLTKMQKELVEQVAGQEQAIVRQEARLAESQANRSRESAQETEHERDLYKATAEHNELKAIMTELGHRQESLVARKQLLSDNLSEVQVLIGGELNLNSTHDSAVVSRDIPPPTRRDIERLKIKVEQHGTLSIEVVEEYREAQEHNDFLSKEIADLQSAVSALTELAEQLDERMQVQFTQGFELVSREFTTFFTTLFDGGSARLMQEDDGVTVAVQLPRKKVTTLETLSGGERALASIALIFAMSQVNPPLFIILDETDAALDEANSQRYASLVQKLSERSQVILITHNRATMAVAHTLYGVTMGGDGVSKLLSVQLTQAQQYAK